ncbi:hypothetical protein CSOJ01_10997 [Colletotrichum sojae]|uniref:Uncharacterized protein n=1 Tax=Colletotrichum sojae TaxID=2175907 RepID=A0A8H6MPF5_9PEZI|nr:hypothetical protein CSOJ01_10997 [Colletotrichum sojae]
MVNVKDAALATIAAYHLATQKCGNASVPLPEVASSLSSFYLQNFTSFTLGVATRLPDDPVPGVLQQLQLYEKSVGTDIRPDRRKGATRVDVVSNESAICFVSFEIFPRAGSGLAPWGWTNMYGFRMQKGRENGLDGGWEFTNADQEYQQLLKRVPDFFAGGKVGQ